MLIDSKTTKAILDSFGIKIKGILHVGAHRCEERQTYHEWGIVDQNIVWLDANPELIALNTCNGIPNNYWAVLDEVERKATFKITNNGQSSSLLDLGTHKTSYPNIVVTKTIEVETQTLENFFKKYTIDPTNYNVWNFDIQGSEYAVFKGSKDYLKYADCIYTEVNTADVYKGCGKLDEMDTLLKEYGLERVRTSMTGASWGDAIYVRVRPVEEKKQEKTTGMTLGIPTYKRFSPFLEAYIPKYLNIPYFDEILICDETGEDVEQIKKQPWGNHPKLRFHVNSERLGAYHNKLSLLNMVRTEWVALIDSDNEVVPEYFEALEAYWKANGKDEKAIYIPADVESRDINETNTRKPISHLGGHVVDKTNWNSFLNIHMSGYALNVGNCVFHKSQIPMIPSTIPKDVMVDCQVVNKSLVEQGCKLVLVPKMKYYHIVHPNSLYMTTITQQQHYHATTDWRIMNS
jgi:FkbM family methyltransferase